MNRRSFLRTVGAGIVGIGIAEQADTAPETRPNILWIVAEDMSCHFGYQGENLIKTPHVDQLAAEGANFRRAYITAPVCSPSRSAMISGMYQTSIGGHHHRSSRGTAKIYLPEHVKLIPQLFREAGYYVCNVAGSNWDKQGKTDYNFVYPNDLYDHPDWNRRKRGQPFFAQIQLHGGKDRGAKVANPVSPSDVTLPPYYPDDPLIREDWARYLNSVIHVDDQIGETMARLRNEGVEDNTVVVFITDHGISHARGKQFCYEEGVHIPFLVWAPKQIPAGTVRDDLVAHIDMAATSLYFAGIPIPEYMESRPLFGPQARPRDYVVSARDRCDETVDRIRGVRKGDHRYIRNFYPKRPYLQPCAYKDNKDILKRIRELHKKGKLNEVQELLMAESRPPEELYDLRSDPYQIHNLADNPAYKETLVDLRTTLETWIKETDDQGQYPEPDARYDSDMKVYVDGQKRNGRTAYAEEVEANIRLMKQWQAEGK